MWSRAPCSGVLYPSNWTLGETAWIGLAHCSSCFSLIWGTVLWPQDCDFSFIFQNIFKVCIPFSGHWLVLYNRKSQLFFFNWHHKITTRTGNLWCSETRGYVLCVTYILGKIISHSPAAFLLGPFVFSKWAPIAKGDD